MVSSRRYIALEGVWNVKDVLFVSFFLILHEVAVDSRMSEVTVVVIILHTSLRRANCL